MKYREMSSKEAYEEILMFKKMCSEYDIVPEQKYLDILQHNYELCIKKEKLYERRNFGRKS